MDSDEHKAHTGVTNEKILINAQWLMQSKIPHTFRTPLIPNITDTEKNLKAIKNFIGDSDWERLQYNPLARAKYESVGREFSLNKSK